MSTLTLVEQVAPPTPNANQIIIYPKADGLLYWKDDAGVERGVADVSAAGAAAIAVALAAARASDIKPNMLINGNWLIDQINEGGLYTITGGGADVQTVDGWSGSAPASVGVFKVRRLADPDNAALKCLEITCTNIDASIAPADAYYLHTAIEGLDAAALMAGTAFAQQITIAFSFRSNVNGLYGISIANSALNRSYVGSFTVADALEHTYFVTLTLDLTGTWLYDTGVGLRLRLCLAAGTNWQKAAGAWGADNMLTTSAQCNFMSSIANIAYLKRIQLVPGSVVLPFAPADMQKELTKCQRYYWKSFPVGVAVAQNGGLAGAINYTAGTSGAIAGGSHLIYPVQMRIVPTTVLYNPAAAAATWRNVSTAANSGTCVPQSVSELGFYVYNPQVAGDTNGNLLAIHATSNARLT